MSDSQSLHNSIIIYIKYIFMGPGIVFPNTIKDGIDLTEDEAPAPTLETFHSHLPSHYPQSRPLPHQ